MNKLIFFLIIIIAPTSLMKSEEPEYLWFKWTESDIQNVDFTLDDEYIIVWNKNLEFWGVTSSEREFFIPTESAGDYNYNEEYLVIVQDSTPKLFDWETREIVGGFEKVPFKLDRIKTAKSKNEFLAKQQGDSNYLFFWNINTKLLIDQINFGYSFEKEGYKWKRTLHEYGYVGNNDQYFYVIISDANNVLENIPSDFHEHHYYVNFYDRETKELVDSVYSFTNTNDQFGGFNKLQVMNNRDHIAWNNEGGVISFYDIQNKRFFKKITYTDNKVSEVNDIDIDSENEIIAIADGLQFLIVDNKSNEVLQEYSFGVEHVKFSHKLDIFSLAGTSSLSLRRKQWVETNINENPNDFSFTISPNPSNSYLNIDLQLYSVEYVKLDVIDMAGSIKESIHEGPLDESLLNKQIDISNYSAGVYFIQLEINNEVFTKQFIKE